MRNAWLESAVVESPLFIKASNGGRGALRLIYTCSLHIPFSILSKISNFELLLWPSFLSVLEGH